MGDQKNGPKCGPTFEPNLVQILDQILVQLRIKFRPNFRPNLVQNLDQIVAEMVQNRGPERVRGAFGRPWGGSWVFPGSKAPVGRFPAGSWAALGMLRGSSWGVAAANVKPS